MSARPAYYAGREPSPGDLGDKHLEMIFEGMKRDIDEPAAERFVDFVAELEDMSATAFLVAFEQFVQAGFMKPKSFVEHQDGQLTARGEALFMEGFALIADALCSKVSPEEKKQRRCARSMTIKGSFLRRHGRKVPRDEWHTCYFGG
jgi:hypothetical protein